MDSQKLTHCKIVYLISFIFNIFPFTFYNKFDETYTIFSLQNRSQNRNRNLYTSRNRNCNLSNVETGTVTFQKSEQEPP